ncbi:uncharacterized protein GBIM_16393 [Gryllus bimaculatus]|nr:uncharacterized protein GBIM_16393 [Gryllus bimaculatus]
MFCNRRLKGCVEKLISHKEQLHAQNWVYLNRQWKSSVAGEDYQYLQRSKVPTFHFQPSLPRLPIPALEKTCERYLAAQQALLPESSFEKTKKIVTEFEKNEGKKLHEKLINKDKQNKHTSYITKPWFDMYLRDRIPLPINYNPSIAFVNNPEKHYNDQVLRASNMLISSLRFMKSLRAEILDPEVYHLNPKKSDTELFKTITRLLPSSVSWYGAYLFKAFPLDMSQYNSLFNASRIPEIGKDRLYQDVNAKHVLVMRNGHFYIFDVIDKNGNIVPPTDILACMKYIAADTTPPAQHPVGVLTTSNRDVWAKNRKKLEAIGNSDVLKAIDSSVFNISLDGVAINEDRDLLVHHILHADGHNRWFDKSFSLLFTQDGYAAVNFEHSWGDGVAVLRYFNDIFNDSSKNPRLHPDSQPSNIDPSKCVRRLDFKLDSEAENIIKEANAEYEKFYKSLNVDIMEFLTFGRNLCKKHKISPDSVMQLGFQLAYYKQNGSYAATYESCSTAAFKHGRTETIRPCTLATKAFCEAVTRRNKPSNAEMRELINNCSKVHGELTKEAAMGQGFDRHLFGLRLMAQEEGMKPQIFEDPAYATINHNVLSTSTLFSNAVYAGAFGPVVKDGYGVGYSIFDERLGAIVTTYPPNRNGADFGKCLRSAFEDIHGVLEGSKS